MKALKVKAAKQLEMIEEAEPQITSPEQVAVKVKRVGICGSDMHIFHGTNPLATLPRVPGHEVTGIVTEIGSAVTSLRVGDHVVVEPIRYCGSCYACRKGHPNVCTNLTVFGVHEDGGMRETIVLPSKQLHKIDAEIPWEEAVMAEPYTIGAQAIWRGEVEQDDTVFIQGAGPIGICILKLAKLKGAKVIISDLSDEKLAYAKNLGADEVINVAKQNTQEAVLNWSNGEGANVVIDAVCIPSTFELSIAVASEAARIIVLSFDERPSEIPALPITKKELIIKGSRLQTHQFPKVIELLNSGQLRQQDLITHEFPFSDAIGAFQFIDQHPEEVRKVILNFEL